MNNISKKILPLNESLKVLKSYAISSLPETLTLTVLLKSSSLSKKQKKVLISDRISLPHPVIRKSTILVLTDSVENKSKIEDKYTNVIVGSEDIIQKIEKNPSFLVEQAIDICICSNTFLDSVKKIESILSNNKLMPSKKNGTVTANLSNSLEELTKHVVKYKTDKFSCIHLVIGTALFSNSQIEENINVVIDSIQKQKTSLSAKDSFNSKYYISSTMGPSLPIHI